MSVTLSGPCVVSTPTGSVQIYTPCCFCMLVKSSNVRVLTGGLQKAYVSMMASRPVLTKRTRGIIPDTHTHTVKVC